jgi:hypothetical protein
MQGRANPLFSVRYYLAFVVLAVGLLFAAVASADSAGTQTKASAGASPAQAGAQLPGSPPATCELQFADVPPSDPYYPYVMCLACQGITTGYPCGEEGEPCNENNDPYFRPANPVTRGQVSKIVALAAGFNEPVETWTFADVPPGSTFYEFVERMAARDVMSGYPCGGSGEPCDSENRPYFRPFVNTTRLQLAIIVLKAALSGEQDSAPQGTGKVSFADVKAGSEADNYLEQLEALKPGILKGFKVAACGSTEMPCNENSDGYFFPWAPATRAETAWLVSWVFLTDCFVQ